MGYARQNACGKYHNRARLMSIDTKIIQFGSELGDCGGTRKDKIPALEDVVRDAMYCSSTEQIEGSRGFGMDHVQQDHKRCGSLFKVLKMISNDSGSQEDEKLPHYGV